MLERLSVMSTMTYRTFPSSAPDSVCACGYAWAGSCGRMRHAHGVSAALDSFPLSLDLCAVHMSHCWRFQLAALTV